MPNVVKAAAESSERMPAAITLELDGTVMDMAFFSCMPRWPGARIVVPASRWISATPTTEATAPVVTVIRSVA